MQILFFLSGVVFFIWIIRNILFWTGLWQLKEYRLDRMRAHLLETSQGRSLFLSLLSLSKWIALFGYVYFILHPSLLPTYHGIILGIYILQAIMVIKELFSHRLKRPMPTIKAQIIIGIAFFTCVLFYMVPLADTYVWLLLLDRFVVFVIWCLVFLFSIPTDLYKDIVIGRAVKKLSLHGDLTVIGVTGSYGKSSTKEYIAQILQKKFRILKTSGTNNTAMGITNTILQRLKKDTQILILEMGAYKKGEIAELCRIARPDIGVLTAVNEQHLSLFGSLQNTMDAKYELIHALPKTGLALFNGNNANAVKLYKKTTKKKILYTRKTKTSEQADIYATNIILGKKSTAFDVVMGEKTVQVSVPIIGIQTIENILPGIYIGYYLGMSTSDIKQSLKTLTPLPQTMNFFTTKNTVCYVDDTFNTNPESILAAVTYMRLYTKKRIFVLSPMIELGKDAREQHVKVGRAIGEVCTDVLLTNKNHAKDIIKGIKEVQGKTTVHILKTQKIVDFIAQNAKKDDVVFFEGKETIPVLVKLKRMDTV